jgi:hypothetical protein
MTPDRVSTVGVRRTRADFLCETHGILEWCGSCVVSMNNESPPINLRAEWKKFCEDIDTAVLGIKCVAF